MELTDKPNKDIKEDYIETLKKDYRYNIEVFDRQSIYIASGALAISLTFVKDIVPLASTIVMWLYYVSISFFSISILLGFLSFLISSEIIRRNKNILEGKRKGVPKNDNITSKLNFANAGLITLGIIFIVIFTIINLNHYKNNLKSEIMKEQERHLVNTENDSTIIKSLRMEDIPESLRNVTNNEPPTNTTTNSDSTSSTNQQSNNDSKK